LAYIRAIINPRDGSGLLRAIALPLAVPQRGAPSIGARTRAKIEEWARASNISIAAALSLVATECTHNARNSENAQMEKENASESIGAEVVLDPTSQSPRNSSSDIVPSEQLLSAELSESALVIKNIGLTARQAISVCSATLLLNGFRDSVENGISVPDLISSVIDRAGFRSRCKPQHSSESCFQIYI
jgi:superfamily I DNA/RNA helicase